jgi:hypothetical protein
MVSHSSPHNLIWAEQFAEQFRSGTPYPRWMPDSFDGLGSPAFYFYPPLPFWLDALVSIATFNLLAVPYRLAVTSLLILWASGLAMRGWLLSVVGKRTAALVGAIAYMAAPYHLLDHYLRGAFAEFTAYAMLPLVMLAIDQTLRRRRRGQPLLAIAYAGLILSHLPTTLLCSITAIPAYVLFTTRSPALLLRCAAAAALGIGLSAAFLLPALQLQDWISAEQLWARYYWPENWFVLSPGRWVDVHIMRIVTSIVLAFALLAAGLCAALLQMPNGDPRRRVLGLWIAVAAGSLVLIAGLLPWFWDLPMIGKVQFPWRLMPVVEFALVTALCLVSFAGLRRLVIYFFAAAAIALVPGAAALAKDAARRMASRLDGIALVRHDVKEYQPRGYKLAGRSYADLGLEHFTAVPLISCTPTAARCRATDESFGRLRVEIAADRPTTVVVRRFFFPAWRLDPALPIAASEPLRLVSFTVPPGQTIARLGRVMLPAEHWGLVISGVSLLLLAVWVLVSARNSSD